MQQKAFIKLLGLQYKLVYKKGLDNKAADALSRQSTFADLNAMSASTSRWLEIIVEGYHQDPQTRQLLTELSITGANDKGFALVDGLIRHKGKIWLGNHSEAHQAVMLTLHSSGLGEGGTVVLLQHTQSEITVFLAKHETRYPTIHFQMLSVLSGQN
jgi:hypothetical protein